MTAAFNPYRRLLAGALTLAAAAWLSACGGGSDTAGVGTGGTGAFVAGPITGFGSVFVNGVRFEDNGARLVDDDGNVKVLGTDDNPLRVGMVVELSGSIDSSGTQRQATQIAYGAELKGPVTAVDAAAGTFTVFGVTVRTTTTPPTIFQNFGGVAALAAGNVVEVHGQPDAAGRILATWVEREATTEAAYAAGGGEYRVRGPLAGLSGSSAAWRFAVRGVAVRTDATTQIDGTPAEGASVSVRLAPTRAGDGSYLAQRLKVRQASYKDVASMSEGEVEGYVSAYDAAAGTLRVAGYAVRLAVGVVYENGVATDLKDGIRVEVKGSIQDGVLVVTRLQFKSRDDNGDGTDDDVSGGGTEFEFKGSVTCIACGPFSGSFQVKGVTISYDSTTKFGDGLAGNTLAGTNVEVHAVAQTTAAGTTYRATQIERNN